MNFRSLKNYTADYYKEALTQVDFPNYENSGAVNEASNFYSKFFQKLMTVIDKTLPIKASEWKEFFRNDLMVRYWKNWTWETNFLRNLRNRDSILIKSYIKKSKIKIWCLKTDCVKKPTGIFWRQAFRNEW